MAYEKSKKKGWIALCRSELQEQFFGLMQKFQKFHFERMIPEVSKMEFITLHQIFQLQRKNGTEKGIYVSELIKKTDALPSAMSRLLKGLEEKGYIQRECDKENRRNTLVCVTEEGKKVGEQVRQRMEGYMDMVFQKMGKEQVVELIRLWEQLLSCMDEELTDMSAGQTPV
ncbi:putative uncharacterized protein [Clostridium sp. CAG:411]|jgi:DNA-binding MarR family transcriptional regulator|nr:MarR family transcriptional regulator [Lachnospiraceae bacterium]CDE42239.1 putative uncharacterized protein [Clostridium sp. CAG:411]